jgi:hypothetical protein
METRLVDEFMDEVGVAVFGKGGMQRLPSGRLHFRSHSMNSSNFGYIESEIHLKIHRKERDDECRVHAKIVRLMQQRK